MKSPMVTNLECIPDKEGYSELKVLMSGAGYYIGTTYLNIEPTGERWEEPGSRDSGYFNTREEAEKYLKTLEIIGDENAALVLRQTP